MANYGKTWDKVFGGASDETGETRFALITRGMARVALDEGHQHYGKISTYIADQCLGRATQKVEIDVPQGRDLGLNAATMAMLGIQSLEATFTNGEGVETSLNLRRSKPEADE